MDEIFSLSQIEQIHDLIQKELGLEMKDTTLAEYLFQLANQTHTLSSFEKANL